MFSFQTIIYNVDELNGKDGDGNFIQTDFDAEIESFIDSIMNDKKMVRQISFMTTEGKLIACISYSDMNEQEKQILSAKKSGLHIVSEKLSTPTA